MKIGVLGGGFGLYGYLPAVLGSGQKAITLERYRSKLMSRPNLRVLIPNVTLVSSESEVLASCEALVYCRDPGSQESFVLENIDILSGMSHVFLEKPLASGVDEHELVLRQLVDKKVSFSVAYIFSHTNWFKEIKTEVISGRSVYIEWDFVFSDSAWKQETSMGGGVPSLLAIHFVQLLVELGLDFQNLVCEQEDA